MKSLGSRRWRATGLTCIRSLSSSLRFFPDLWLICPQTLQIARNSFIATSTVYASTEFNFDRRSFCFFAPGKCASGYDLKWIETETVKRRTKPHVRIFNSYWSLQLVICRQIWLCRVEIGEGVQQCTQQSSRLDLSLFLFIWYDVLSVIVSSFLQMDLCHRFSTSLLRGVDLVS